MISYFKSVGSKASDLTWPVFEKMLDDFDIKNIIRNVRQQASHDAQGAIKKKLPAITWQSHFKVGEKRSNETAEPTGFFMLDLDKVEEPRKLYEQIAPKMNPDKTLLVNVTPSGHGLRIVYENFEGMTSIEQNQKHLAEMLGVDYDEACKDFARLSFVCSRDDLLYLNPALFNMGPQKICIQNENYYKAQSASSDIFSGSNVSGSATGNELLNDNHTNGAVDSAQPSESTPLVYKDNLTYDTIVKELVVAMGGEPHEGSRNTFLYRLARKMRYIVDFSPAKLEKILPTFGLPQSEVTGVCQSACKSARSEKIPYDLYMILKRFETTEDDLEEVDEEENEGEVKLPPLPPIFKQFCRIAPDDFKVPTIFALLPVIGTLSSRLRAIYLDGDKHAPNFTTVIEAPQASGKSFARRIKNICMEQVEYMDSISRVAEQQYIMQLKRARNSKNQPEEPTAIIRIIPASVSIAKLLKRLANSKGLHLFSFLEELDTLTKSNKAGAWSQKTDIYRNAFDNAEYGQEYMSENSYSGIFPVYYNMLTCGTPAAVARFYHDPEDGLISRVIFCQIPSQFGAKMPVFMKLTRFELNMIQNKCAQLNDELCCTAEQEVVPEKVIDVSYLNKAIDRWNEHQRLESIREVSTSRNVFYRRAAVTGFRAGMVAHYLYGKEDKQTRKDVVRFALFVADYMLNSLLDKFGQSLEKSIKGKAKEVQVDLFKQLPDTFERNDVIAAIKKFSIATPVKQVIYNWKKYNYIKETGKFKYIKIYDSRK